MVARRSARAYMYMCLNDEDISPGDIVQIIESGLTERKRQYFKVIEIEDKVTILEWISNKPLSKTANQFRYSRPHGLRKVA